MQQDELAAQTSNDAVAPQHQEITSVPLWVKGIVAAGALLFAIDIPDFKSSLSDAIQKKRAETAYDHGHFEQAIERYGDLQARYPKDHDLVQRLGFSYYEAGQYSEALETFSRLSGVSMSKRDAAQIDAAVTDLTAKLQASE